VSILGGTTACAGRGDEKPGDTFSSPVVSVLESSPLPTAAPVPPLTLEANSGGAKGTVVAYPDDWAGKELYAYFAPFTPGERADEGFYILEPSIHPGTSVDSGGYFQLGDIPPGKYVVVVGPDVESSIPIRHQDRPRILEIVPGEVLDLGEVDLRD